MKSLLVASVFASSFLPFPQVATYDLLWRPAMNDAMSYKMHLDIDSTPEKFIFTASIKTHVLKVKPNGDYDVETSTKDLKVKHGAHEEPINDDSKPSVDTFNRRGEKIATSEDEDPTDENNPGLQAVDSITDELTPEAPVKIGETWTAVIKPNAKLKREAGKVTYTLSGVEKQGAYQTFKITYSYRETEKDTPMTVDGYVMLSQGDFSLVRFEGTLKGAHFSNDPDFPMGDAVLSLIRD